MAKTCPFRYPNIPQEFKDQHFTNAEQLLVVGVLGRSHHPDANKMAPFDVLQYFPSLDVDLAPPEWPCDTDITFYFQPATASTTTVPSKSGCSGARDQQQVAKPTAAVLYMHIVSPSDTAAVLHHCSGPDAAEGRGSGPNDDEDDGDDGDDDARNILTLTAWARSRSARLLLLAIQVCHIVVLSEPTGTFDASQLLVFKALRAIRDKFVVPVLPDVLRQLVAARGGKETAEENGEPSSETALLFSALMAATNTRDVRLCSPRFLFYFERLAPGFSGDVKQLEFDVEDRIYKMLRHEFVITNNSAASLFSIPRNKRFVYINAPQATPKEAGATTDDWLVASGDHNGFADVSADPLLDSLSMLEEFIEASSRDHRRSAGAAEANGGGDFDDIRPYRGFAKPLKLYEPKAEARPEKRRRCFVDLLREHLNEALVDGFDDSCSKFKGKSQFLVPAVRDWFDMFDVMHDLFVVEADKKETATTNSTTVGAEEDKFGAAHFKQQLRDHLDNAFNSDMRFFRECGEHGIDVAVDIYLDMLPAHYSFDFHQHKTQLAYNHLLRFARLPATAQLLRARLTDACDAIWLAGRQQCEFASLRGNPCAQPKQHNNGSSPETAAEHASSVVYIAACNCGRMQGRRDDPYTVRQANYEFFQLMAATCPGACQAADKHVRMPVFQPSVRDFRAAAIGKKKVEGFAATGDAVATQEDRSASSDAVHEVDASQTQQNSLYLNFTEAEGNDVAVSGLDSSSEGVAKVVENEERADDDDDDDDGSSSSGSFNELLLNRHDQHNESADGLGDTSTASLAQSSDAEATAATATYSAVGHNNAHITRQPSTVEYLPGMLHTASPAGLLPQFPSWSLVCIGPSSMYSHSSGLAEHMQGGFLAGSNMLLPWDVHVRLEHAAAWAAAYERSRSRRKQPSVVRQAVATTTTSATMTRRGNNAAAQATAGGGLVITLKVFIGCEYECPCGHRFFMASPTRVLRGGLADIAKDSGHRVVFNDMPLYVACPCRSSDPGSSGRNAPDAPPQRIAQLMRVHIVTPKAPVNVIIDPHVRVGGKDGPVFVLGIVPAAPRLAPSSYWVLRLPYVYQADDGPLLPPGRLAPGEPLTNYGCLQAAMFGIAEIEGGISAGRDDEQYQ